MHRRYVPSAKITKTARRRLIRRINLFRFAPFSFFFSPPSSPRLTRRARTTAPLKFNIYAFDRQVVDRSKPLPNRNFVGNRRKTV
jgi:hypothetical protein